MDLTFFTVETLVLQTIILGIILWVLHNFLFKPYLKYLDEFEEKQKKIEDDYKNIDNLLLEAEEKKQAIISEARTTSKEIVANAEELAKKKKEEILASAENDAKAIIES
jgi:F-type H+-transporting ATPase subunit b